MASKTALHHTQHANQQLLTQSGWLLRTAAEGRTKLDLKLRGNITVQLKDTPQETFGTLAEMAGLEIEKGSEFATAPPASLSLKGIDVPEALDLLSLQTRHVWHVVSEHTIRVMPNSDAARRNLEPRERRRFAPADSSKEGLEEMLNILRAVFGLSEAAVDENTIAVRDTADNLALVPVLMDILGKPARN